MERIKNNVGEDAAKKSITGKPKRISRKKALSRETAAEAKESKEAPAILLIYRDNDLFQKYMTEVSQKLLSLGRKVETHVFPVGTAQEEIKGWLQKHREKLQDKLLLSDATVPSGLDNSDALLKNFTRKDSYGQFLNTLFERATAETLLHALGQDVKRALYYTPEREDSDFVRMGTVILFRAILATPKYRPTHVKIDDWKIRDHFPLRGFPSDHEAIEEVRRWLREAGIADDVLNRRQEERADNMVYWKIFDRHCLTTNENPVIFKDESDGSRSIDITLRLPLSNLFGDALRGGLFVLNEDQETILHNKIMERLEKDFYRPLL